MLVPDIVREAVAVQVHPEPGRLCCRERGLLQKRAAARNLKQHAGLLDGRAHAGRIELGQPVAPRTLGRAAEAQVYLREVRHAVPVDVCYYCLASGGIVRSRFAHINRDSLLEEGHDVVSDDASVDLVQVSAGTVDEGSVQVDDSVSVEIHRTERSRRRECCRRQPGCRREAHCSRAERGDVSSPPEPRATTELPHEIRAPIAVQVHPVAANTISWRHGGSSRERRPR